MIISLVLWQTLLFYLYIFSNENEKKLNTTTKSYCKIVEIGNIVEMGKQHLNSGGIIYDMNVNEHEKQVNFTLRHKLKQRKNSFIAVLHLSVTIGRQLWGLCNHPLPAVELYSLLMSIKDTSGHLCVLV